MKGILFIHTTNKMEHIPEKAWCCFSLLACTSKLLKAACKTKNLIFYGPFALQMMLHNFLSPSTPPLSCPLSYFCTLSRKVGTLNKKKKHSSYSGIPQNPLPQMKGREASKPPQHHEGKTNSSSHPSFSYRS